MNFKQSLILASKSPRRQQLLKDAGFDFEVITKDVKEDFPIDLPASQVAKYLAKKKASAFDKELDGKVLITADTVVIKDSVLGKPADRDEAITMLEELSDAKHEVITGVCLKNSSKTVVFDDVTEVYFKTLTRQEIEYYIDNYKPFDKAGAYGIQEWIGMIGITKIVGSYFNVVGLPVQKLYEELAGF